MASSIIVTSALVVDLHGDQGNIFAVLATVTAWMREQGFPPHLQESMFNSALSACSYAAALKVIADHSGAQFVFCGRPFDVPGLGRAQ
ncbi:hypothetical protein [Methyloceanibacter sp.]|uniref:hypothetical protein n=1 Tax=Methyloceanibacter sp. TaxID=1965321 RepID=UPI003D6C80DC